MRINITQVPSTYIVAEWEYSWFSTNAKGSPLSKYYVFKPRVWVNNPNTKYREQVEQRLYFLHGYNKGEVPLLDIQIARTADAIVKLHEAELERIIPEKVKPGLVFGEDFSRGFNRAVRVARRRAAITPKGGDKK